jgi:hypothetical protein
MLPSSREEHSHYTQTSHDGFFSSAASDCSRLILIAKNALTTTMNAFSMTSI